MKRHLFTLILLLLGTLMGHAQYSVLNGDLNHDGRITVEDVTMLTNIVLEKSPGQTIESTAELNYGVPMAESAELLSAKAFCAAIKQLVKPLAGYSSIDDTIKKITFRRGSTDQGTIVSTAGSLGEARAVYNAEMQEVDIYVGANKLVFPENCSTMFDSFYSVTQIDWSAFGPNIDTSKVTNMSSMFYECEALTTLDVSNFDTSNVTKMGWMFSGCRALTTLDVTNFDTSKVTSMPWMFSNCPALTTLDVTNFDTSNVTDMHNMFMNCPALTTLDVTNFDTSNVTDMSSMFHWCDKLSSLKLGSNFTIADGCDTSGMLGGIPDDADTPYCTITCTAATQAKLRNPDTGINESVILWNIL